MRPIVTDRVAWFVGLSVCLSVCHTSELCKNGWTDRDAVSVEDSGGAKETCITWGPALLRDVAMATNFGTKIAINWLCVNDSDYAIGYGGDLSGRPTECSYCRYPAPSRRCHGNHFWLSIYGCSLAPPGEYD